MGIQHFSHPRHLLDLVDSIEVISKVPNCNCCNEVMNFPGYACDYAICEFYLHKSCAELAEKISHPLHPHPLILLTQIPGSRFDFDGIICDGCRNLYRKGFTYYCSWSCGFNLHPKCASKVIDDEELLQHQTFKQVTQLYHFFHKHALNFCNLRESNEKDCCCCKQRISGSAYCCVQCHFYIHESCKEIPMEVQHPFHPQHILLAQAVDIFKSTRYECDACKMSIDGVRISCNMCNFHLHVSCANPNRFALKHTSHDHNMFHFVEEDDTTGYFKCNNCHERCFHESFYRCVECDFNLHFKCIPIPSVVKITQKHHHPLTLIDSVKDDNPLFQYLMDSNDIVDYSMDYYCDECEAPGNPKHHAYCCKECIYIAHIECIISEGNTPLENLSNLNLTHVTEPKKEEKMSDEADFHLSTEQAAQSMSKKNGATSLDNEEHISHPSHPHKLTLLQLESNGGSSGEEINYCKGCNEVMCFPGYACESAKCKFYLHKSCAVLPPKILHPLHPHPLTFFICDGRDLICDGCRDLYDSGFTFNCSWCRFNLDAKCASKPDQEHHQTFKEHTIYRFYHKHALKLCNVPKTERPIRCCCCRQIISTGSSAYCCIECQIIIHESCTEIPMEIHHPFHPQHPLLAQDVDYDECIGCDACKWSIHGIKISCNECTFQLHVSCANPNICACALKHAFHEHNMYYFVGSFKCNKCHERYADESVYRCVECDFNLHLKCIPIPSIVEIIRKHHHPLTLIDSVKEDNPLIQYLMDSNDKVDYSMDYYCDICETPGNPKRHAYCCKECIFIAHLECIISKDDTSPETPLNLNPIQRRSQRKSKR